MTDIPIIFSGSMVLALLREAEQPGTGKTMTRRMLYAKRRAATPNSRGGIVRSDYQPPRMSMADPIGEYWTLTGWDKVKPGDKLWVRERVTQKLGTNFLTGEPLDFVEAAYAADGADIVDHLGFNLLPWWRGAGDLTPLHMPRAVSRLTLTVTGTKIERVQDISEADAAAEGIPAAGRENPFGICRREFSELWHRLHGPDSWDANPWVVALTFTVAARNIDRLAEAA